MAQFNDPQRSWVDDFLGENSRVTAPAPGPTGGAKGVLPTSGVMAKPVPAGIGDGPSTDVLKEQGVLMFGKAGPDGGATGATGPGTTTGGTGPDAPSGGNSGSGTSGTPPKKPSAFAVDPERVVKLNKLDTKVFASVSSPAHADAWRMHNMAPPVPIAFQADKFIYVDMSRWPPNLEKPTTTLHAPGGPKINPKPGDKVNPMRFPDDGTHTLAGTTDKPGGGAGKGPGGTVAVPDDKIAATHQKAPSKTKYTFSTAAHTEIWAQLGNKPPAPIAFMQDGYMRVDVERYGSQKGQLSGERLGHIGLVPTDPRLKVGYRGEPGVQASGSKDYPGHREPPPGVYDKQKALPNADMRDGANRAQDAIKKSHTDPQGVWKNSIEPDLKKRLDDFADPNNKVGKSVKNIDIQGKSAVDLHKELIDKGFKYHWEPLAAGFDDQKRQLYKMRDGGKTLDPNHSNVVPHDIYVHPDGGMVRVKPEGDPGDKFRPEPHASKSVVYDTTKGSGFNNEAFKVTNEGNAVPKNTNGDNGMKQAPSTGKTNADVNMGYKDATMSKAHTSLPKVDKGVAAPKTPTPGSTPHVPDAHVNVKLAEAFIGTAKDSKKIADDVEKKHKQGDTHTDTTKLAKQTISLEGDAEVLAKQFKSHPDLAKLAGAKAKEFFASVRAQFSSVTVARGTIVMLALNVAQAYEIVEQIRNILDSKNVNEAIRKSIQLGAEMGKEMVKFGAIRFVVRRTSVAVFITTFLGDMDKSSKLSASESFKRQIAKVVNTIRPDSIIPGHASGATPWNFKDAETKKIFEDALKQAIGELKRNMAGQMTSVGYKDGLTGTKTVSKFEVSKDDKEILDIDEKFLEQAYNKGVADGARRKSDALKRARDEGLADGKGGKPSDPQRLDHWYELKQLVKRLEEVKDDEDLVADSIGVQNQYYDKYKEGYAEGRKAFTTTLYEKLIVEPQNFSIAAYAKRKLKATGITKDGKTVDLTELITNWNVVPKGAVSIVKLDAGSTPLPGAYVQAIAKGTAKIEAEYNTSSHYLLGKTSVTVTEPKLLISTKPHQLFQDPDSKDGLMAMVGEKNIQFIASVSAGDHYDEVPDFFLAWTSAPSNVLSIDRMGNATFLKEGKATVTVKDTKSSATTTLDISVEPAGSIVLGGKTRVKKVNR